MADIISKLEKAYHGKGEQLPSGDYNELYSRIKADENWLDDMILLCHFYDKDNPAGGCLHNVLDDGNLDDESVVFCQGVACGHEDELGSNIASLVRAMSMKQRKMLYRAIWE